MWYRVARRILASDVLGDQEFWDMAQGADNSLKEGASHGHRAVSDFIGHDLSDSPSELMHAYTLEQAYGEEGDGLAHQELDTRFAPLREWLRTKYGPTLRLYRNEHIEDPSVSRNALSWTANREFAEHLNRGGEPKAYTTFDVVERDKNGTEWYVTPEEAADYLNWDDEEYRTNYDKLPVSTRNRAKAEAWARKLGDATGMTFLVREENHEPPVVGKIREEDVPLEYLIWASNRSNQNEFIVRNRDER